MGRAEGRERKGERGSGRKKRVGKGKGGLDLDLCHSRGPPVPSYATVWDRQTDRGSDGMITASLNVSDRPTVGWA